MTNMHGMPDPRDYFRPTMRLKRDARSQPKRKNGHNPQFDMLSYYPEATLKLMKKFRSKFLYKFIIMISYEVN